MPNGDKIRPKSTREHLLSIYGYITGLKKDVKHMHDGIHDLGGKIDKIYCCLLYTSPSPRDVEESRMPSSA